MGADDTHVDVANPPDSPKQILAEEREISAENIGDWNVDDQYRDVRYGVTDCPPWYEAIFLGLQHYLTMLGATVLIPSLLVPAMGGSDLRKAQMIQTIFFVSGINTLVQSFFGTRLPVIIGGSFSFLTPTFSIIFDPELQAIKDNDERFLATIRAVSGAIIAASALHIILGFSGLMGFVSRFIGPLVIAPVIASIGLALYGAGFPTVGNCVEIGIPQIVTVILFSQYLRNVSIFKVRVFELFPVLLGLVLTWLYAVALTEAGVYDNAPPDTQASCRTDQSNVLSDAKWFRIPYPGQWGRPTFKAGHVFAIVAGALAAIVESTGDFYACARISGATPPPPGVISRGIGWEGIGILLDGLFGTGNGSTTYAENIGAIGITKVGSRRVVQVGAALMILFSIIGKFGALFASIPSPMVGGLFCVMFGIIAAVGLSNLQFANMNSPRNIFVVGFALFMGFSVADYFSKYNIAHKKYPIQTDAGWFNDICNVLFSTNMAVALICAFFLDNTIPGSRKDRGLEMWDKFRTGKTDPRSHKYYDLPLGLSQSPFFQWCFWLGVPKNKD